MLEGETNKKYPIAFIDDRSRKILSHKIIADKSSSSTSRALLLAIHFNSFPKVMINDNGNEFVGREFTEILRDCNIEIRRTHLYTRYKKMERWKDGGKHSK